MIMFGISIAGLNCRAGYATEYNITFSVRFFCPRAISKLGDKTHPPGHIFLIIIFVLDIPAVSILEYPN